MEAPQTPRHATDEELAEHLRGLVHFMDRENRDSMKWMAEKPFKRLKFDRLAAWLDVRFVERYMISQTDTNTFCELVDDRFGIAIWRKEFNNEPIWWREAQVAYDQGADLFLVASGKLAVFFLYEDWDDAPCLLICRRKT